MMIFMSVVMAVLGAVWRVFDGAGYGPGGLRVAAGAVVALLAAAVGLWPADLLDWTVTAAIAATATWAVVKGYDDWASWRNLYHYWPASIGIGLAIAHSHDVLGGLIYLGLLVIAGAAHPVATWLDAHNRYTEGVVGACVLGGLTVL